MSVSYYPSSSSYAYSYSSLLGPNRQFNSQTYRHHIQISTLSFVTRRGLKSTNPGNSRLAVCSVSVSPWDDKPHRELPRGEVSYYDERDVVSFLDPPKELIPLDPSTYNPATYLWKKIDDIPEERRHRLLSLLDPRLITRAWEVAGTRYDNSKLAKKSSSSLFAGEAGAKLLEFWHCRTNGGPLAVAWINYFKTALFCCKDGQSFGRVIDASVFRGISRSFAPLYFTVREVSEVMSTEEPCDVAYEFGTGLLDLQEYPEGFPKPVGLVTFDDRCLYMKIIFKGYMCIVGAVLQVNKSVDKLLKDGFSGNGVQRGLQSSFEIFPFSPSQAPFFPMDVC